jgi:hypothetical protein
MQAFATSKGSEMSGLPRFLLIAFEELLIFQETTRALGVADTDSLRVICLRLIWLDSVRVAGEGKSSKRWKGPTRVASAGKGSEDRVCSGEA